MNRRDVLAIGGAVLAGGLAGCVGITGGRELTREFTRLIDGRDIDHLSVETRTGDIDVAVASTEMVTVRGTRAAASKADLAAVSLEEDLSEGHLTLTVDVQDVDNEVLGVEVRPTPEIALEIEVPATVALDQLGSATGAITLEGTTGELAVETATGDVDLRRHTGDVTAALTTGDARLADVEGDITAESTTGSIVIRRVTGSVVAATTTGDIDVASVTGDVHTETTTGEVSGEDIGGDVTSG